jgi:hypothetical protein
VFSDQIHSDSKKIKTKRKRMMGWIINGPTKYQADFLSVNTFLPKPTILLLDLSLYRLVPIFHPPFALSELSNFDAFYSTILPG